MRTQTLLGVLVHICIKSWDSRERYGAFENFAQNVCTTLHIRNQATYLIFESFLDDAFLQGNANNFNNKCIRLGQFGGNESNQPCVSEIRVFGVILGNFSLGPSRILTKFT